MNFFLIKLKLYISNSNYPSLYSSEKPTQPTINKIKSVKLNLVLSDFTKDHINFAQDSYTFQLNSKTLLANKDNSVALGFITAFMDVNSEFNSHIKYYLDLEAETKAEFTELFELNSETGLLKLNRERFLGDVNNFNRRFEFHVEALSQCASEAPLKNRTTIAVTVLDLNQTQFQVLNLSDTKRVTASYECVRLTRDMLAANKVIALAQVIIFVC